MAAAGVFSADLTHRLFLPAFANDVLSRLEDQAVCSLAPHADARIAFTTDSFVVRPIFFPGGDIGQLAVHGTVNDLAMGGATPLFLSAAFILEEGLPIADLEFLYDHPLHLHLLAGPDYSAAIVEPTNPALFPGQSGPRRSVTTRTATPPWPR